MAAGQYAHMDLRAVEQVADVLGQAGSTLAGEWQATRSGVDTGEAGISGGPLGAAFRGVYDTERASARQIADGLPGAISADGAVARQSAADYRAADQASAAAFPGAGG